MNTSYAHVGVCPTERYFDVLLASGSWEIVSESQLVELPDEVVTFCAPHGGYYGQVTDEDREYMGEEL
jgi:hypothetical protein